MQKNKLGELLSYYCSAQSLNRWAVIAGSWVFWNREAQRSFSSLFLTWSLIVKLRNICPGTSSNGWRDHRRKQKLEQGKKFLTFLRHCSVCDYRTEQPKAQKLLVALSAGLGNSSKSRRTTTRAMTTKNSSKLNGNVCPLMDPQPSTSSYLPPVYWVNLNNIVNDTPNWRYFPFL